MISSPDRHKALELIDEACRAGARRGAACAELKLSPRTVQRWRGEDGVRADARPEARRPEPTNKLTALERQRVLDLCHSAEFVSLPPGQIVPRLADRGEYIASESSFYRILRAAGEQHHRGRGRAPRKLGPAARHCAHRPGQVWSWDITWLAGPVRGYFFYLYLIVDIYSRKIVGWEVHERESAGLAAELVRRAVMAENGIGKPLILHADNGSPQKGATLMATLDHLGVRASYSRPRVSDDNAYSESLFRTCKYRPAFPRGGFETLEAARQWVFDFVRWYNEEHRHSAIRYVTPAERHRGTDRELLGHRRSVYEAARVKNPERWTGGIRDWTPVDEVWLNRPPEGAAETEKLSEAA